jgi:hypothetical protein
MLAMGRDLAVETSGAVTKILDCGVEHHDVWPPNVLMEFRDHQCGAGGF